MNNTVWIPCTDPQEGMTVRFDEPIWAAPNKPRGKPDKIGEQRIEAEVVTVGEIYELRIIAAEKLSGGEHADVKVKAGDLIRRKLSTLERGNCHTTAP